MGAEVFHEIGRTDKTKLTVGFRNFANAPKNKNIKACDLNAVTDRTRRYICLHINAVATVLRYKYDTIFTT